MNFTTADSPGVCPDTASPSSNVRLVAQATLRAIEAAEPQLHAWTYLADIESLDVPDSGSLAGLTFGVKDNIDVAGMPTRCGSPVSIGVPAHFDASCVAQLRAAGAIPIGKTVTTEYAYVSPGPTRNPANPKHTPGGSSSGSAAAVAAGLVPIALGTQTGGSIIRPAAFCGVIGFKPSAGLVSRDGMKLACESLDVIGWYGRDMAHVNAVAKVLLPGQNEHIQQLNDLRLAYFPDPLHKLDVDASGALDKARRRLALHGANIASITEFPKAPELLHTHSVLMHYELARSLQAVIAGNQERLSPRLLAAVEHGRNIPGHDYLRARQMQYQSQSSWEQWFGDADLILTSGALGAAPMGLHYTGDSAFNKGWSVLGWPCIHLPTDHSPLGLPIGVMLVARPHADCDLLGWARLIHPLIDERSIKYRPEDHQP